ncbi:MAG: VanZ family protein [Desulfobacterales bacterium]|nr:VanZ family protein [Desulfobacterales bacterium]
MKDFFNIKWLMVAVIFTATVVFLTHLPEEAMPSRLQVSGPDKLAHALAYGEITILFILSVRTSLILLSSSLLFFVILGIGAIDELTQPLVHRTASLTDWLANVMGIVIVLLCLVWFKNSKR